MSINKHSTLVGVGLGFSLVYLGMLVSMAYNGFQMDLQVFQDAGFAIVRGEPLFDGFHTRSGFAFIYPPFAALLMAPMSVIGATPLQLAWAAVEAFSVAVTMYGGLRLARVDKDHAWCWAACLLGIGLWIEPIRNGLFFGQVDIVLVALVVADLAGMTPRRFRGVLIGIAAGIKITPLAFLLILALRKDVASILRAIVTLAATIVIGFAARPSDSRLFWTEVVLDTNRAGDKSFFRNQALTGLLSRHGLTPDTALFVGVWAVLVAIVLIIALYALVVLTKRGDQLGVLFVFALLVCTAQPYAVTHHWAIMSVLVPLVAVQFARGFEYKWWCVLLLVIQGVGPNWLADPDRGFSSNPFLSALGDIQGVTAIIALVCCALLVRRGMVLTPPPQQPVAATV